MFHDFAAGRYHHAGPLFRQSNGDGFANASAGSSHDSDLIL
jgi:hypothetical protein